MNLDTLANLAEILGVIIVVGGFGFAVIQILQFRRQRREMAAIEVTRSFVDPDFAHALRLVQSLPDGIRAQEMRRRDPKYEDAAMLVSLTFESVGVMLQRRVVSMEMVWDLMGGVVLRSWAKLSGWTADVREEQGRVKFNEWLEWLAGQLQRHKEERGARPAYVEHANWRPR